jgi:hypothetical protein
MESGVNVSNIPKRQYKLRLTPRDYNFLLAIFRFGFLTAKDARDEFWDKKDNRNHLKRIRILENHRLIEKLLVHEPSDIPYRLTKLGEQLIRKRGLVSQNSAYKCPRYSTPYNHDKALNRLLRRLEESPSVAHIETEKDLHVRYKQKLEIFSQRQEEFKIPDGLIALRGSGGAVIECALELELHLKSRNAYRKIFRDYQRTSHWQCILYVVSDHRSLSLMSAILKELYKQKDYTAALLDSSPIYLTTLQEFQADPLSAVISACSQTTSLRQMAQHWPVSNPFRSGS